MRHPQYCLTHHPGISSNTINATCFTTPATSTTLAHRPLYPRWWTTHATHTGTSLQHAAYITHASTSPTLHATNANIPSTLARHFSNSWVLNQAFKAFRSQISRGNLAVFTFNFYFYSLYFLGLFKHLHISPENFHRKIKLYQRKLVRLIQKATILPKTNAQLFQKKLFPNISVALVIQYTIVY